MEGGGKSVRKEEEGGREEKSRKGGVESIGRGRGREGFLLCTYTCLSIETKRHFICLFSRAQTSGLYDLMQAVKKEGDG